MGWILWLCMYCVIPTCLSQKGCMSVRQWGNRCDKYCSNNCANFPCNKSTGKCNGCNAGLYGDQCNFYCTSIYAGCAQCTQDGRQCTACQKYSYKSGRSCVACSSNCWNYQCDPHSGTCINCTSIDRWGNQCDKYCSNNCMSFPCNRSTGKCNGCNAGFHGDQCNSFCTSISARCTQCTQDGRQCTACQDGYYKSGQSCVPCSSNCVDNQCDPDSGRCKSCWYSQWGDQCENSCSSNCATSYCNRDTGKCDDGCLNGYYGDQCNFLCSSRISKCSECTQVGQCTACSDGYYLSYNSQSVHTCVRCSWKCQDRQCDPGNGRCYSCMHSHRVSYGLWGNQCEKKCSSQCATYRCNQSTGKCDGCKPGYHGDQCNSPCSSITSQCSQCTQDGQCTGCSGNFRSPQCTDCDTGYFGKQCNLPCSSKRARCSRCTQDGHCTMCSDNFKPPECTDCKSGTYLSGNTCVRCGYNCKNLQCDPVSGRCDSCLLMKWGNKCENTCNKKCSFGHCNRSTGKCDGCQPGYHGDQCSSPCSSITAQCSQCTQDGQCVECTGKFKPPQCTVCEDKYYLSGNTCVPCNRGCKGRQCNPASGRCGSCKYQRWIGYLWGNQCTEVCSKHCATYPCNRNTGKCDGCKPGYYGDQCDSPCNSITSQCSQCTQEGQCTECNGNFQPPKCTDCVTSRWGTLCEKTCSSLCAAQTCNRGTGKCEACQEGYYLSGNKCVQCSENCKDRQCNPVSGRCDDCVNYRWGKRCGNYCSRQCATITCHRSNGKCNGCKNESYYGDHCNQSCSQVSRGCSQCTQDGDCTACRIKFQSPGCTDCEGKTYGNNCENSCGHCKQEQACDSLTGECTAGCGPGFNSSDKLCKTKCDGGTHGENCSLDCGHCQGNITCHHATGECGAAGCVPGFSGAQCLYAIPPEESSLGAIGAIVCVLLIIIIIVVVIIVFRRHRQRTNKSNGITREAVEMSGNMEELNSNTNPSGGSHTPLSFAAMAVDGDAHPKPKEAMKPKPKPAVKPKPSQTANSSGVIYENIPSPVVLSTKSADKGNASVSNTSAQSSNSRASSGGKNMDKPATAVKPTKVKAVHTSSENLPEPEDFEAEGPAYGNYQKYLTTPKGLVLRQLRESVADKLRGTTLEQEFGHMTPVKNFSMVNGNRQENYYKNRYNNILPYDKNRVQLDKVDGVDASDFFNASFIKGFRLEKGYIASQGPKTNIHNDFWRMVWQEKVTDIVMLTSLKEGIKDKCSEYWPAERATMKTRHMEVTGVGDVETRAHFVIRTFDIKHKEGKEKHRVKQYHYISWMDHEVPAITPLINFWRYIRTHAPRLPSAPPLLVHCSAGVGRTGTFIALDIAIDEAEQSSEVNLFNIVDRLRDDRCFMVQNKSQYEFLHEAFLEAYTSHGTRIEVAAMDTALPASFNRNTPNAKIDAEFEVLNKMRNCPSVPSYTRANMPENTAKNRNPRVLPNDKHLVYITQHVRGCNQYINGVSMSTFLQQRGSIMTQLPLPDTVIDLWRLVYGADVKLIVSLGDVEGQQDMCCYWPQNDKKPLKIGPYVIRMKSSSQIGSALWSYTLTQKKEGNTKEVNVLHYTNWTGECADNTAELIHLLMTMQRVEKDRGDNPVIIQCIDGSLRSSVLCALWDVVSRMTHDEELDVYMAARMVTVARPEAFVSVEQYRYCYEVALQIKNSCNVYSNT